MRKVSALVSAVALLGTTLLPVTISACPAQSSEVKPCCCCGPKPAQKGCPCPCPKPAESLPGDACVVQKSTPNATLPPATALETAPFLPALPPMAELRVSFSATLRPALRIEPGWDPGNRGFVLPLRL